ncbi:MAG: hypothetical protein LBG80_04785 [Bacteroidales bacterium]|jgi:hypothetical protein|nr:hypothetical protein [Bacteroidales bacterium]
MKKISFVTIVILSVSAIIAVNIRLAMQNNVDVNYFTLNKLEALSDETYDGGELPTVTITCSATPCTVGQCWKVKDPNAPNKTCIISGSMYDFCSYNCPNN